MNTDPLAQYQQTYLNARDQALRDMGERTQTNFHEHGLNQNGDPLRSYANQTNEATREVHIVEASPAKPKIGAGHAQAMGRMGLDELAKPLAAFPDSIQPMPEPGAFGEPTPQEVFAQKQDVESPLQAIQADLYTPQLENTTPEWAAYGSTAPENNTVYGQPEPTYARTPNQQPEMESGVHGETTASPETQASQDVQLPQPVSLEMYQRGLQAEYQPQQQPEMEP